MRASVVSAHELAPSIKRMQSGKPRISGVELEYVTDVNELTPEKGCMVDILRGRKLDVHIV